MVLRISFAAGMQNSCEKAISFAKIVQITSGHTTITVYHQIEARASIVSRRGFDGPLFRGGLIFRGGGAFNTNNQLAGTFNSGAFNSNKTFDRNLK